MFNFSFLGWMMGLSASIKFSGKNDLIVQEDCDKSVRKICQMWIEIQLEYEMNLAS